MNSMFIGNGTLRLLNILIKSIGAEGRGAKVINALAKSLPKEILAGFKEVTSFKDADIVLTDMSVITQNKDILSRLVEELSSNSLLIVLNAITGIDLWPEFTKELSTRGFTRALLPIGDGVAIFIKRGYDITFFKKTIEVYRESFIYGPNPIDYNTAYFLYALTKFILVRKRGIAVEIGTGRGFSTLWLVHAAKEVNSQVISIDNKCDRVSYTLKVMKDLKLDNYVEVLCSDARNYKHYRESIAFMFIDGKKDEYHQYLNVTEKYLVPGALVLAHNTLSDAHKMKLYIEKVYTPPYESLTIATDPKGLTVSIFMGRV